MRALWTSWWHQLRVQQKVLTILLVVFIPLVGSIVGQAALIAHIRTLQWQHHEIILAREQIQVLRRLMVDIEDGFRGYLLTHRDVFLGPMRDAEPKLRPTIDHIVLLLQGLPQGRVDARQTAERLLELLESKRLLIEQVQAGQLDRVLRYVKSGQGIALSDALRDEFRLMEDDIEKHLQILADDEAWLTRLAFWGLVLAVGAAIALGLTGANLLAQSITGPLSALEASVSTLGKEGESERLLQAMAIRSFDEIGQLARAYQTMAQRIRQHIQELETLIAIGHEINTIGVDGLDGVLQRITDSAALLLKADACLVMSRNEKMGCWIVEAASGEWHERLYKSIMLWEEFPVSVQAFETGQPAIGENLRLDQRPEVARRNLMGESMLAIPLLSQGAPFGVLVLLMHRSVARDFWNVKLAQGLAGEAATAIVNAHLLEAEQERGKGLRLRLRQLEHLAETLAHDLKGPGERMQGLAEMLRKDYGAQLDSRAFRWLSLLEEGGRELTERVHDMLEVARVGARSDSVEAVDVGLVIQDVLKQQVGDIDRMEVHMQPVLPLVACHRAYLRQVFDNLISNAVKFAGHRENPEIRITATRKQDCVCFSVCDNGPGIPVAQRERVFQPFTRLNPEGTKGSGIGLTIVRRIVELYGGQVWVDSEAGEGCCVKFTLPALGDFSAGQPRPVEMQDLPREDSGAEGRLDEARIQRPDLKRDGR